MRDIPETLRHWFVQNRRSFPWRDSPSPYQVWISEVMLQQTQASRVIAYYERWMERFPSLEHLAQATLEEVFKVWEGLGYYSRAKSLHAASKDLCSRFQGKLPSSREELLSIKGLGPYTASAIAAFAFHQKAAAVDANVLRVLTRLFEIRDDIGKIATQKNVREIAEKILPDKEPWVISEALIELGACICKQKPNCAHCPLQASCKSFKNGSEQEIPFKARRTQYEALFREVAVIMCGTSVLVRQGKKGQPCAGLFEFPYFETVPSGLLPDVVEKRIAQDLTLTASFQQYLEEQFHSFTRFRVTLYPKLFEVATNKPVPGCSWYPLDKVDQLTFSSGHRRVLRSLLEV
ncbi:MAG: A/G-specific adenine glycosylase [Verrucomicrobia bacterium]|nr:A/G-specific adenine glycosylase [Verrucomicrobiota bacterium]